MKAPPFVGNCDHTPISRHLVTRIGCRVSAYSPYFGLEVFTFVKKAYTSLLFPYFSLFVFVSPIEGSPRRDYINDFSYAVSPLMVVGMMV